MLKILKRKKSRITLLEIFKLPHSQRLTTPRMHNYFLFFSDICKSKKNSYEKKVWGRENSLLFLISVSSVLLLLLAIPLFIFHFTFRYNFHHVDSFFFFFFPFISQNKLRILFLSYHWNSSFHVVLLFTSSLVWIFVHKYRSYISL